MIKHCESFFGALFGHKYKPRYDNSSILPGQFKISNGSIEAIEALKDTKSIYVCDLCVRCGHVIRREEK